MQDLALAYQQLSKPTSEISIQTDEPEGENKQKLIGSQQVMKKESGSWVSLGGSKQLSQQLHLLYTDLEKGLHPNQIPDFRKRLFHVKTHFDGLISEEAETGSVFTLSEDEENGRTWSPTVIHHSPHFSLSRIEQKEDFMTELKEKEGVIEDLKKEICEKDRKIQEIITDNAELRAEKMVYFKKNEEIEQLKLSLEHFMSIKTSETDEIAKIRSDLAQERSILSDEQASFRQKRHQLSEKISQINEKQKKLQNKEKLLTEKETILLLQEKKADLHKEAVDQLWRENDEKRLELCKCQKMIDDEWKLIMEETRQFEALKIADKRGKMELEIQKNEVNSRLEKVKSEENRVRGVIMKVTKDREVVEKEKVKLREERRVLTQERMNLIQAKNALREVVSRWQNRGSAEQRTGKGNREQDLETLDKILIEEGDRL